MHLLHRPLASEDLDACFSVTSERHLYDTTGEASLKSLWRFLLESGGGESDYITDSEGASPTPPMAFGISAFITDRCCEELQAFPQPCVSRQILDRWLRGEAPIMNESERRAANTGTGLNLLILSRGSSAPGSKDFYPVSRALMDGFFARHRGYHLKEVLAECIGQQALAQFRFGGWETRSDYQDYYDRNLLPLPTPDRQPYLMGLTRAEAVADPGRSIATLFNYTPPRFFFRPGEQTLLSNALSGETDPELAQVLGISLWTIKKRWQAIYERVSAAAPDLLPESGETLAEPRRGAEKRRRLLAYLRDHHEELRPLKSG